MQWCQLWYCLPSCVILSLFRIDISWRLLMSNCSIHFKNALILHNTLLYAHEQWSCNRILTVQCNYCIKQLSQMQYVNCHISCIVYYTSCIWSTVIKAVTFYHVTLLRIGLLEILQYHFLKELSEDDLNTNSFNHPNYVTSVFDNLFETLCS